MKKIFILINLIFVFSNNYGQTNKYDIAFYSKFLINGNLTLNMTEEDLIKSLGQPEIIEYLTEDPTQYKTLKYKTKKSEFTFNTTDSYLSSVQINSELIPLFYKGINISIGQNVLILKKLFPNSFSLADDSDKQVFLNLKGDDEDLFEFFINFKWNFNEDDKSLKSKKITEFLFSEYD
jgi:hypothetical protein